VPEALTAWVTSIIFSRVGVMGIAPGPASDLPAGHYIYATRLGGRVIRQLFIVVN